MICRADEAVDKTLSLMISYCGRLRYWCILFLLTVHACAIVVLFILDSSCTHSVSIKVQNQNGVALFFPH
jgi:succinate dehydrogenase/fumarate reductase cytochrome b subunit